MARVRRSDEVRVAMIGQRGVPAAFGGIEHHVEELGWRLVDRGHDVTVFCRTNYVTDRLPIYRGMRLRHLPTIGSKHLDALTHSAASTLTALRDRYDVVHYHALGPGVFAPLPKYLSGARVIQTVHGLDHQRAKWGRAARAFLTSAAWLSGHVPDATVVVSEALAEHYQQEYGCSALYIPNGVDEPSSRPPPAEIARRWGLSRGSYLLFVGRLVPEKAPDLLVRAFRKVDTDVRLVLAGGSSFTDEYASSLRASVAADPRVLLTGYVYGQELAELYSNAAAFVLPSALEGFPLTLLEAASYGTPVVASAIPPHMQVLGRERAGVRLFPTGEEEELVAALRRCFEDRGVERQGAADLREEVLQRYRWDEVATATERTYLELLNRPRGQRQCPDRWALSEP